MGCSIFTFLSLLVILGLTSSKPTGSYQYRVQQWENDFQNAKSISCQTNNGVQTDNTADIVQTAKNKKYPSTLETMDELAAARVVNMYTLPSCLYRLVNKGLRENKLSDTFRRYSDLLNEAINKLSDELNDGCLEYDAYRGTKECAEITSVGKTTLKGFTSTSTNPKVPFNNEDFDCTIYISFKGIQGLNVFQISAIEDENEVLLKSNYQIDVTEYITHESDIVKKMKEIKADFSENEIQQVKKFVTATSLTSTTLACNKAVPARSIMIHSLILCVLPYIITKMN